jgi:DNA-binding transcriptional LysR family regulator
MELRQLAYFAAVAEERSFTRAAVRVFVAQPAISQQIAQLERDLDEKLFDRSGRRVRLTPAGEALLPYARAALAAVTDGRDAVQSLRGELVGHLTVGSIPVPPPWLPQQLGTFQRRHPKVRVLVRTGDPEQLASAVATGALDVAVIGVTGARQPAGPTGQRLPATVASSPLEQEPLVVVTAADHWLAQYPTVDLAQLQDEPIATLTTGTGLRSVLEHACAPLGFSPNIHTETDDLGVLADLAVHGLGVAIMPRSAARRAGPQVPMLTLRRPALRRRTVLIWHRHHSTAPARAFLGIVKARDQSARARGVTSG